MFGKKDKDKETVENKGSLKYIILGYGYKSCVYSEKDDLLEKIKKSEQIMFTRLLDESKLEHEKTRDCSAISRRANYSYDYDWIIAKDRNAVVADRAYVPFKNKEELDLSYLNKDYDYNTVRRIYKSIIQDILELDSRVDYHMITNNGLNNETVPYSLNPCIWSLDEDEITEKNMTAKFYVFCTVDKVPKNLFYYLDDTPCNELDPIDVSILIQGSTFNTSYINILCDFKDKCQRWLKEKDVTTNRLKETFGEDICE